VTRGDVDAALTANPPTPYRVPRASVESPMNRSQWTRGCVARVIEVT